MAQIKDWMRFTGILNIKIKKLNYFTNKRIKIANFYLKNKKQKYSSTQIESKKKHVFHLFVVKIKNNLRNKFIKRLKKNNINPGIHYLLPNHKQIPYKKYENNKLRVTNIISPQIL